MAVEVDALSCIVVSPVEYVMSMVVPYHDGFAFWNIKILTLLMILVSHYMLVALIKMRIDGFRVNAVSLSDCVCQFMHLFHGGSLSDDGNTLTNRFGILWQLFRFRQVWLPCGYHFLKSSCRVNNRVASHAVYGRYCQLFSVFAQFRFTAEMLCRITFLSLTDLVSHRLEVGRLPHLVEV